MICYPLLYTYSGLAAHREILSSSIESWTKPSFLPPYHYPWQPFGFSQAKSAFSEHGSHLIPDNGKIHTKIAPTYLPMNNHNISKLMISPNSLKTTNTFR